MVKAYMRLAGGCLALSFGLGACSAAPRRAHDPRSGIPFDYIGHLQTVDVRVADSIDARFIFDTGSGMNVISQLLCRKIGCKTATSYSARRMSGQALEVSLSTIASLSFGPQRQTDVKVGVIDLESLGGVGIDGFLSLRFFEKTPFTIDYAARRIFLEDESSLSAREAKGVSVPVRVDRDSQTLTFFLPLTLPGGGTASAEVDTGSNALIFDERFMPLFGLDPSRATVKRVEGKDETGHTFVRYFIDAPGPVYPGTASDFAQSPVRLMFQKIIYDGLVGQSFLKPHLVTFDVPSSRMIFTKTRPRSRRHAYRCPREESPCAPRRGTARLDGAH